MYEPRRKSSNINTVCMYHKLRAAAEPLLLAFPTSSMAEAGLGHVSAILTKQKNRLNLQNRGDLPLRFTKFQPNVNNLPVARKAHPSH